MTNELDCRGLSCPGPVLKTRDTLNKNSTNIITVLVDSESAKQNVTRFLEHQNFKVSSESHGADFRVIGKNEGVLGVDKVSGHEPTVEEMRTDVKRIMVIITSNCMGHGDDDLGDMLQFSLLKTLKEMGPDLWRLVFVNSGVHFTAEGSEAVPVLQELAKEGVQIRACGACLAYFHILDKMKVGEITNMLDIVTGMKLADSVVTI